MNFEFATAGRILFGAGKGRDLSALAASLGTRALLVVGRSPDRAQRFIADLKQRGVPAVLFHVPGEPTTDLVQAGTNLARTEQCDLIIGVGGGSVLDAAKAISALLTNQGELFDFLEVVGRGQPLLQPAAPCLAVPTTAGTGAEVTRNAVLGSPSHRVKVSLRSPHLLPRVAVVDPELTHDLPPALTASTGFDALTQLIEPYVSIRANPMTDAFCREGLRRVARSLRRAFDDGKDAAAREDMALASLFGGLALANAGLGAVHGFASPIGGMFPAPHGAVCAALLPHVMESNLRALRNRSPQSLAIRRYDDVAQLLTGNRSATADDGVAWVRSLGTALEIPPLSGYGVSSQHFSELIEKAAKASSMKANPIPLTDEELDAILQVAL